MRFVAAILVVAGVLSLVSCGGNSSAAQSGSVVINTQPADQAVPIGRTATFTVVATGPSLTYQWSSKGADIPEATAASYTTPTVSLADTGTEYQVTVSSGSDSLTSNVATLTAGPRAPAIGDVRYLLWQQAGPAMNPPPDNAGVFGEGISFTATNALGAPINMLGGAECGWNFIYLAVPSSMNGEYTSYYEQGSTSQGSWQSYLASLNEPDIVIISTDLEWATCGEIVAAYVQVQAGGFDYKKEEVAPSAVAATVAADGAASRIITAVTYDDTVSPSQVVLISYGWQGDTTTVYESQSVLMSPGDGVEVTPAETLASDGYFISAFGGNVTDGYVMVGMRVQGDTMPRPLDLGNGKSVTAAPPDNAYWSVVAYLSGFISEQ